MTREDLIKLLQESEPTPLWQIECNILYNAFVSDADRKRYEDWKAKKNVSTGLKLYLVKRDK